MFKMLELVKKLGLNEYESKAYLALLGLNSASASNVSRVSLIPRARVYDVLTSLEKKGFIEKKLSKPVSYLALGPLGVAKKIGKEKKSLFEGELREILRIGGVLEQNTSKKEPGLVQLDEIRLVRGRENIYSKIALELENAVESVFFSSTPLGVQRKRTEFKRKLDSLSKKGIKISFREVNGFRYCVLDKKTLFLFLNPEEEKNENETALLIRNPFLAQQFLAK